MLRHNDRTFRRSLLLCNSRRMLRHNDHTFRRHLLLCAYVITMTASELFANKLRFLSVSERPLRRKSRTLLLPGWAASRERCLENSACYARTTLSSVYLIKIRFLELAAFIFGCLVVILPAYRVSVYFKVTTEIRLGTFAILSK
jgi:hypothetical protein